MFNHSDPRKGPYSPHPQLRCTCRVMSIYIPNGQHIHIQCPVHGEVVRYGSTITYAV